VVRGLEQIVADGRLRHHRLDESRAVADRQEMDLAARAPVVQPPFDGDLRALMPADVFDVDVHRCNLVMADGRWLMAVDETMAISH
jgi:hypothetical protein